jgi:uncharacterized protein
MAVGIIGRFCSLIVITYLTLPSAIAAAPKMALIVDDLGYNLERAERVVALPGPVTIAVLPFTTQGRAVAEYASAHGADVLLHQPMESIGEARPAAGTLTKAMSAEELSTAFTEALDAVPHAIGVSNHAGSLLTADADAMALVMIEIRSRGLFFVDSRTTPLTVALDVARSAGVPATKRDVFLDNRLEPDAIAKEYARAVEIAHKQGHVVVIAHPHDATFDFLERALASADVELASVRELVQLPRSVPSAMLIEPGLRRFEIQRVLVERSPDDRADEAHVAGARATVQGFEIAEMRHTP